MTSPQGRNHDALAREYVEGVLSGDILACKFVRQACERHRRDLERQNDPGWGFYYSPGWGAHACRFLERLPHVEGAWDSPTIVLEPWQVFGLMSVFGWRRKGQGWTADADSDDLPEGYDGGRRFTDVYEEVARKNGKSAKISGVALYCLTEDEPGPQVKTAATTGDQARIVWNAAKKMAEQTPSLREAAGVECFANSIVCNRNGGSMQPINAKASTQDGLNPSMVVLDELHAHKDRALYDVLRSARGARRNPLQWVVTTAGYNLEGVCYEQRKLAAKVLEGTIEADHMFALIYTLDEGDDPLDPRVWRKANPNLGVSVFLRDMEAYAETARNSADSLIEFTTKRCNVWSGSRAPWLNLEKWKRCRGQVDRDETRGAAAFGGLDLASVSDIAAFAAVVPWGDRFRLRVRMYVPEAAVKPRTERGNVPYQRWVRDGWLIQTPGDVTDYEFIERDIRESLDFWDMQAIAYDPWNAYHLVNQLTDDGAPMVEFRQGPKSYAPAMREFERAVNSGSLEHDGNPVLQWMASNLIVRKDVNENLAPDRKNSDEKIDGLVATIMALGLAATHEGDGGVSVPMDYEAGVA